MCAERKDDFDLVKGVSHKHNYRSVRHVINADVDRTRRRRLQNLATLYAVGRTVRGSYTLPVQNNSISMAVANLIVSLARERDNIARPMRRILIARFPCAKSRDDERSATHSVTPLH